MNKWMSWAGENALRMLAEYMAGDVAAVKQFLGEPIDINEAYSLDFKLNGIAYKYPTPYGTIHSVAYSWDPRFPEFYDHIVMPQHTLGTTITDFLIRDHKVMPDTRFIVYQTPVNIKNP